MARTYDGVTVERDTLRDALTALRVGREALIEIEETAPALEAWDPQDRQMHEHDKKVIGKAIEEIEGILGDTP